MREGHNDGRPSFKAGRAAPRRRGRPIYAQFTMGNGYLVTISYHKYSGLYRGADGPRDRAVELVLREARPPRAI